MGNITPTSGKYYSWYYSISDKEIQNIRTNYKVIDVGFLNIDVVNIKLLKDDYFETKPEKKELINGMVEYYLTDRDKKIYEKTDYLCNEKNKICICNTNADVFRQISDGKNYKPNMKYISWCKNTNDNF